MYSFKLILNRILEGIPTYGGPLGPRVIVIGRDFRTPNT